MCKQIIEKYAVCRCTYLEHAIDPCNLRSRTHHKVQRREVLVGYTCGTHSRSIFKQRNVSDDTRTIEPAAIYNVNSPGLTSEDRFTNNENTSNSLEEPPAPVSSRTRNRSDKEAKASQRASLRTSLLVEIERYRNQDSRFVDSPDFQRLVSTRFMESELDIPDTGNAGLTERRQIFSILLLADSLELYWSLWNDGVKDIHLPLTDEKARHHSKLYKSVLQWSPELRQKVYFHQQTLLEATSFESQHLILSQDPVFPYTVIEQIGEGAFGSVRKARIENTSEFLLQSRNLVPVGLRAHDLFLFNGNGYIEINSGSKGVLRLLF